MEPTVPQPPASSLDLVLYSNCLFFCWLFSLYFHICFIPTHFPNMSICFLLTFNCACAEVNSCLGWEMASLQLTLFFSHTISLSISFSFFLCECPSITLTLCLCFFSLFHILIYLFTYLFLSISLLNPCLSLCLCLSVFINFYLSLSLPIFPCLFFTLSFFLWLHLSPSLTLCVSFLSCFEGCHTTTTMRFHSKLFSVAFDALLK